MSDLPPPSSQQVHEPPFFHLSDGQRMQIFVEAGGILNRPRLIRKLKRHDAHICTDPKNAQVILVDANSWQGKEFIREWGQDQNKVVLSYAWVTASEKAGRPLLAEDDWGACLTKDDGLPILKPTGLGDEKELGTAYAPFVLAVATEPELSPRSLLPTPRETPVESEFAQSKSVHGSEKGSEKASSHKLFTHSNVTASPHIDSYEGPSAHPMSHSQSHLLYHQQQTQSPSMPSPSTTDSTSMFPSNMPFGAPNGAMNPFNMAMNMMPLPNNMLSIFAQQQQQQQQPPVSSSMIPPPSSMLPNMPENFTTALMDIMKMYGSVPGGTSTGPWSTFPGSASQQNSQILPQPPAGSSTSGTMVREGSSGTSSGRRNTESPDLSILSNRPPSSSKRKRQSNSSLYDSTDDDGEDEVPLAHLEKKKKASVVKQPADREERTARRTSSSFSAPGRNPHSKSSTVTPSSSGSLFVNEDGSPMQFYVQVDLKGRSEVIRAIKKNGGTLTADIGIADYAVLWSKSTTFKELLGNASATQTPAVTYHFILDAASEGNIPENLENYLFDVKQNFKSKRAPKTPAAAQRRRVMQNARRAEKRARERDLENSLAAKSKPQKPSTPSTPTVGTFPVKGLDRALKKVEEPKGSTATPVVQKPQVIPASKSTPTSSSSPTKAVGKKPQYYYPREQTPPLPSKSEQLKSGWYSYTSDERDWMEKYAFILFKRDPSMNRTDIANAFHEKLPHHSLRSIAQFLRSTYDEQYNMAKKKGGIAHRKEKSQWEQEQQNEQQKEEAREKDEKTGELCQPHIEQAVEDIKQPENEQDVEDAMEIVTESHTEVNEGTLPVPEPMDIDETTHSTAESAGPPREEKDGTSLTAIEEEDIRVFLQVFASGDDPEQSEDQFFEKLGQVATCKSAPTWRDFNTRHEQQIMDRFAKQMGTAHGTEEL